MNPRERYLETLLFGHPDSIPLAPGGPRESTLRVWHQQGLPADVDYRDELSRILHIARQAFDTLDSVPVSLRMNPTFEERVLEHRDGHYVVQDWMGAVTEISDLYDYTYIRSAKDFVTRRWHKFPVQNRSDWEKMAWRYRAQDPARFPADFAPRARGLEASGRALAVSVNGPFWQMREWVGMENLCVLMLDQPDFVGEMADFWRRFTIETLESTFRQVRVDALMASEDMAYKAHSMISPAMARRFLQPTYQGWCELCNSYGVPLLDMDSDGDIGELVPIWLESGFNVCNPIEVAAGNDIVDFRRRFGRRMAYHGGIDKRAIAVGGATMCAEVSRVGPLLRDGGYIPGCDHGVPPDISWGDFCAYSRLLAQLAGWV